MFIMSVAQQRASVVAAGLTVSKIMIPFYTFPSILNASESASFDLSSSRKQNRRIAALRCQNHSQTSDKQ